jgi:RNA polymerase sigma-70 factor (ECF subfamily)
MTATDDPGPTPGPSDADLLRAHVSGDSDAFGVLFARHRDRLWAVALRTMGNPEDAADGLQDGLIAAYRRAGSFRGEAAVTTWLHRVVVNACLDRLRAAKVRRTEPLPDDLEEYGDRGSLPSAASPAADPAEQALAAERRRTVLAALATLPPEQRAALVLVDMEGYPVAEAALMLDCAVGTVKSRCSRGRDRLAQLLHDAGPDGEPRDEPHDEPRDERHDEPRNPTAAQPVPPRRGGAPRWPTVPPQVPPTG